MSYISSDKTPPKPAFTFLKLTIETIEQGVQNVYWVIFKSALVYLHM